MKTTGIFLTSDLSNLVMLARVLMGSDLVFFPETLDKIRRAVEPDLVTDLLDRIFRI